MAFQNKNLNVIAYANGWTMWHYSTDDKLEDVLNGYFNPVQDLMNINDMIVLNTADMNCMMFVKEKQNKNIKLG